MSVFLLDVGRRRRHLELGLFSRLRFLEIFDGKLELLDQMPGALGRSCGMRQSIPDKRYES